MHDRCAPASGAGPATLPHTKESARKSLRHPPKITMSLAVFIRRSVVSGPETPRQETTVVLMRAKVEIAAWPLAAGGTPDMAVVEQLARLQLAASRLGYSIRLRHPSQPLWELLDLAGLADVVVRLGCLVVEVSGEPEGGKEIGVEKRMEPGDPVA